MKRQVLTGLLSLELIAGCAYMPNNLEIGKGSHDESIAGVKAFDFMINAYYSGYYPDRNPKKFNKIDHMIQEYDEELSDYLFFHAIVANHERKEGNLNAASAALARGYSMLPVIVDEEWLQQKEHTGTKKDALTGLNYTNGIVCKQRFEQNDFDGADPEFVYETGRNSLIKALELSDNFLLDLNIRRNITQLDKLWQEYE